MLQHTIITLHYILDTITF
uniref:Uncharacterized protein n=1 Tax=Anguilla anguilla TaxID=7936 RepID=A0A0E9ULK2_ANGAN